MSDTILSVVLHPAFGLAIAAIPTAWKLGQLVCRRKRQPESADRRIERERKARVRAVEHKTKRSKPKPRNLGPMGGSTRGNTAVGYAALAALTNTTGTNNTAVGTWKVDTDD